MSKKLKRIIAIIALVFVAVFTVSLIAYFIDKTLLNGAIGFLTMFSGGIGLALFLVIWLSRDNYNSDRDDEPYERKGKTLDDPDAQRTQENGKTVEVGVAENSQDKNSEDGSGNKTEISNSDESDPQ